MTRRRPSDSVRRSSIWWFGHRASLTLGAAQCQPALWEGWGVGGAIRALWSLSFVRRTASGQCNLGKGRREERHVALSLPQAPVWIGVLVMFACFLLLACSFDLFAASVPTTRNHSFGLFFPRWLRGTPLVPPTTDHSFGLFFLRWSELRFQFHQPRTIPSVYSFYDGLRYGTKCYMLMGLKSRLSFGSVRL